MLIGEEGSLRGSKIFRATVRNRAKLAYNGVAAWLEGKGPMPGPVAAVEGLDANKVERRVGKSAAAMLLESRTGERFDAIVTGASEKGTWVRLLRPPVEGRLIHGFEGADVGHRVRVQLVHADVDRGYIDFKKVE